MIMSSYDCWGAYLVSTLKYSVSSTVLGDCFSTISHRGHFPCFSMYSLNPSISLAIFGGVNVVANNCR